MLANQYYDASYRAIGDVQRDSMISPGRPVDSSSWRENMLLGRLAGTMVEGAKVHSYDFLETALSGETIFVFLVVRGKPVTLEDDIAMFPSDTLITQLRVLNE